MRIPALPVPWILLSLAIATRVAFAQYPPSNYPSWWSSYGVLSGTKPDDFSVANQGQTKNMAVAADAELDNDIPQFGGAGAAVDQLAATLTGTSSLTNDFLAISLGQLKNILQPFYDHLLSIGYKAGPLSSGTYPWVASGKTANDFAVANLGQLKYLFSFDVNYSSADTGIPDWWVQNYLPGSTFDDEFGVDPAGYVAWSDSTTNLQAYQQGLNPTDFYHGTLPTLTPVSEAALGTMEQGTVEAITVLVTDTNGNPIPKAPVTFTTDYALLSSSNSSASSISQTIQVTTDANGLATIDAIAPLCPGNPFAITVFAQTLGEITSTTFTGATASDSMIAVPHPCASAPTPIPEPALWTAAGGVSFGNPAFRQFQVFNGDTTQRTPIYTDVPPILYYRVENQTASYQTDAPDDSTMVNDSYALIQSLVSLTGGIAVTGSSSTNYNAYEDDSIYTGLIAFDYAQAIATGTVQNWENGWGNTWSGTDTNWNLYEFSGTNSTPLTQPPWEPIVPTPGTTPLTAYYWYTSVGNIGVTFNEAETTTNMDVTASYPNETDGWPIATSVNIALSDEYKQSQFITDVLAQFTLPSISNTNNFTMGDNMALATWNCPDDTSSLTIADASYYFACPTTGTTAYPFEWYEVFQPAATGTNTPPPVQATYYRWGNAYTQAQSETYGPFYVDDADPANPPPNGSWYLARFDTQTAATFPACHWRHTIGIGESVGLKIIGLPPTISSTSVVWSPVSKSVGRLTGRRNSLTNNFIAGRNSGSVTMTVTLPGGATMNTTLTIIAPTGVTYTMDFPITGITGIGAGIQGHYTLLPTTVSFGGCEFQEETCPSVSPEGIFKDLPTIWHNPNGDSNFTKPSGPNPTWITINDDNTTEDYDYAQMGGFYLNLLYFLGGASPSSYVTGNQPGPLEYLINGFTWNIPLEYNMLQSPDDGVLLSTPMNQTMTFDTSGACTVQKGDASVSR